MKVKLTLEQFRDRMGRMSPIISQGILGGMRAGLLLAQKTSKRQYFLGGIGASHPRILNSRSGKLRNSVRIIEPYASGGVYVGGLRAGGPKVPYAAIHEYGGVTHPRVTWKMRVFAFHRYRETGNEMWLGIARTKKKTLTVRIPARPYLYPALERSLPQISKQVSVAVEVAFAKGLGGG